MRLRATLLTLAFCLLSAPGLCDTIVLRNGESLNGRITSESLRFQTGFGAVELEKEFLYRIVFESEGTLSCTVSTVHNDSLPARLTDTRIGLKPVYGDAFEVETTRIKKIDFETPRQTEQRDTALFFLFDGSRFSGRLDRQAVDIETGQETLRIALFHLSRLEITDTIESSVTAKLTDGSVIKGRLVQERLGVLPDSFHGVSVCAGTVEAVQFKVKRYQPSGFPHASFGVLDADSDGVADEDDRCPDTPCGAVVDDDGCQRPDDIDGDGVADAGDACPGSPAGVAVNEKGCWELAPVFFKIDSYAIEKKYRPALDELAEAMNANAEIRLSIVGHTDVTGPGGYNERLSLMRASAIKQYLVQKGVAPNRLAVSGKGATTPMTDDASDQGRALNRRVELIPK